MLQTTLKRNMKECAKLALRNAERKKMSSFMSGSSDEWFQLSPLTLSSRQLLIE
jgi:hypothetical protein